MLSRWEYLSIERIIWHLEVEYIESTFLLLNFGNTYILVLLNVEGDFGGCEKSEDILNKPEIDDLVRAVEEATRATVMSTTRFIEPAGSTLSRAMSKRNHIVFGRRGSGKTSLLLKAKRDLSLKRTPVAFVDMEQFKSHSYPDVLISVLIATRIF